MAESYTSRTLREIVRIIASRFWGMLILFTVVVGAVVVASLYSPRWYRSEVQMKAQPTRMTHPVEEVATSMKEQVSLFISTHRRIIRSDYVLASALKKLEEDEKSPPTSANENSWREAGKPWFELPEIKEYIQKNSKKLRQFKDRVSVKTPGGADATFTQTFTITVDWPEQTDGTFKLDRKEGDRKLAADQCQQLAQNIVGAYLRRYKETRTEETEAVQKFVKENPLATAEAEYTKAVTELTNKANELGSDLNVVTNIIAGQGNDTGIALEITRLSNKIAQDDALLAEYGALKDVIETELKSDPAQMAVPDDVLKTNPAMNLLQQKMTQLKLELNALVPKYTEKHHPIIHLRQEIQAGYQDLQDEMKRQEIRVSQKIQQLEAGRKSSFTKAKDLKEDMKKLASEAITYNRLKSRVASAKDYFEIQKKADLEAQRAQALAENPILVSIMDDPTLPNVDDPRRPVLWLNILIACVGGLVLALVYAFLSDHFDHTLKSVDDTERYLGVPVLASVSKLGRGIIRSR